MTKIGRVSYFVVGMAIALNGMNVSAHAIRSEKKELVGRLEVICGSMFAGKTEELMRKLRRAEHRKRHVLTIKHGIDNRYSKGCIVSHEKRERSAYIVGGVTADNLADLKVECDKADVIGIDEVQFFGPQIIDLIDSLVKDGKRVIVAGLDLDFRGEPFGIMPILMAHADKVTKLQAVCVVCGKNAYYSQRLIDGRPAAYDDPVIMVGDMYEARCRDCFVILKSSIDASPENNNRE